MSLEHIRLSQVAKDQLSRLKRFTGIQNWNVLCRWAVCVSLAETSVPPFSKLPADSNVEMTWKVFAGDNADLFRALLVRRCLADGFATDDDTVSEQFRLHLHRGIAYLAADKGLRTIADLVRKGGIMR
jgi:DNA sulfur modification protein DndE